MIFRLHLIAIEELFLLISSIKIAINLNSIIQWKKKENVKFEGDTASPYQSYFIVFIKMFVITQRNKYTRKLTSNFGCVHVWIK